MSRLSKMGGIAALAGILALGAGLAVPAANEMWNPTPTGTWYFATDASMLAGPGAALPAFVTFHDDGTLTYTDAAMFGALPALPLMGSPYHGVWRFTGPGRFGGTSVGLLFDPASSAMIGFSRARSALRFDRDLGRISGTIYVETAMCTVPMVVCPDPTAPTVTWTPVGDPINGFKVSLTRLSRVPAGPLQ
jgi:hypothetical protein